MVHSNGINVNGNASFEKVDGTVNENTESLTLDELNDKRDANIVYLKPSKILDGMYYASKLFCQNSLDNNNINHENIDFNSFSDPLHLLYFHLVISLCVKYVIMHSNFPNENDLVGAYPLLKIEI